MYNTLRRAVPFVLLVALLGPAACGEDDKQSDTASQASDGGGSGSGGADLTKKPTVDVPAGDPPAALQSKDIVVGTGAEAANGQKVSVQYVGVSFSTKEQFDASWDRGSPFKFTLGAGDVIQGWDQGVVGMKVGGRRQLVIPPGLAYGPGGYPPVIAANETLVFVIDLVGLS